MYQWPTRYFAWVDSDLETFNSWWPSPNLLRCTNLNYSPGAGIKWSHTHAIGMLVRTMPVFKSLSGFIVYFDFLFLFDFSPLSPCSKLANFTLLSSALSSAPKFSKTENPCWPDNQSDILPTWSTFQNQLLVMLNFDWIHRNRGAQAMVSHHVSRKVVRSDLFIPVHISHLQHNFILSILSPLLK